jgi:hypothetical protein
VYLLYRYVLRIGFLDGKEGTAFHVLQGFWYRYFVDINLHEVKRYIRRSDADVRTAIRNVLGIEVGGENRPDDYIKDTEAAAASSYNIGTSRNLLSWGLVSANCFRRQDRASGVGGDHESGV